MPESNELKLPVAWRKWLNLGIYGILLGIIYMEANWLTECHNRADRLQDKNDKWLDQFINEKLQKVEQKVDQKITEVDSLKTEITK